MILGLAAGFTGLLPAGRRALRQRPADHRRRRASRSRSSAATCRTSSSAASSRASTIIPRLFTVHILLVPGLILALDRPAPVLRRAAQAHALRRSRAGPTATSSAPPLFPVYIAKAGGFFFIVFGVLALMGATMTINPVWNYGPVRPVAGLRRSPAGLVHALPRGCAAPDAGAGTEWVIGGYTLSLNVLIPAMIVPGHPVHARSPPTRSSRRTPPATSASTTSWTARATRRCARRSASPILTAFVVLILAGLERHHRHALRAVDQRHHERLPGRLPDRSRSLAFWVTKRICLGLQRKDRELVLHGHETGRIVRFDVTASTSRSTGRWTSTSGGSGCSTSPVGRLELLPAEDERGVRRRGLPAGTRSARDSRGSSTRTASSRSRRPSWPPRSRTASTTPCRPRSRARHRAPAAPDRHGDAGRAPGRRRRRRPSGPDRRAIAPCTSGAESGNAPSDRGCSP